MTRKIHQDDDGGITVKAKVGFSLVLTTNQAVSRAIASIGEQDWTPVRYSGAVPDPATGGLICDAEVAEVALPAFTPPKHPFTARLIVRRVRDQAHQQQELFPIWLYHPSSPPAPRRPT